MTSFPLGTTFQGVSISVTQNGVTTQAYPIYVSASQVNVVMPSSVTAGPATVRAFYQNVKSNATTIQIANSTPGLFAVSGGGYGPGSIQNYVAAANQPLNSLTTPAAPGQVVTIWGTGLGPVTFPDNVAPSPGNVSTPVTLTIGGQPANVAYSGRSPCCACVDQIVATIPANAPLGCWVPVYVNAGGVVSNTITMAIAASGAASCDDPGNPLSNLVRTPGTQAVIDLNQAADVDNLNTAVPVTTAASQLYSRFYTRPNTPLNAFNFDPYLSLAPAGTCIVHQSTGDSQINLDLRGALPDSASISPQPNQTYNTGTQTFSLPASGPFSAYTVGATVDSTSVGLPPPGNGANFTIDPGGPNQKVLPINLEKPPAWTPSSGILTAPRNASYTVNFTPGDNASPTMVEIYAYSAAVNATVDVQCVAAAGAKTFTIPADMLADLPASAPIIDGSYAKLQIGTLGTNNAVSFSNGLAANAVFLNSTWVSQTVVLQ